MALLSPSSFKHRSPGKPPARPSAFTPYDRLIPPGRFIYVVINYLIIFFGWQSFFEPAIYPVLFIPIFYGFISWIGPRFLSYQTTNLLLTLGDLLWVSLGFYYLPGIGPALFTGYLIGIVINIFYGGIITSIILSGLATLGFAAATLLHLHSPLVLPNIFYYTIIGFNLTTALFCIAGIKIKDTIRLVEREKEETKKQLHRLEALSRIAGEIAGELEVDKLLFLILQKAIQLVAVRTGGIILKDSDEVFRIKTVKGLPKSLLEKEINLENAPGTGLLGKVFTEKRTVFGKNITDFAGILPVSEHQEHHHFAIAAPIRSKGEILGLIFLFDDHHHDSFSRDEQLILETLGEHAAIAVVNAKLFKQTTTLSLNDYLTGVGNIRYFFQQLDHTLAIAERYQQSCSLMIVDSDSLKPINDRYGNSQGFRHIKQLAEILKKFIRNADIIARYDRDMFMIILPQTSTQEARALGERIQNEVIQSPFICDGKTVEITVCIGIATYPTDVTNSQNLVSLVEACLHYAKRLGKNKIITTGEYKP
jgi:diguanylate cyclase (GGDEF)-like protein